MDIDTEPRPTWLERFRAIPRGVWGCGLVALALVTPFFVRAWFLSQVPDIGDPFDVAAFCKSMEVPPEHDARTAYRNAARKYHGEQMSPYERPSDGELTTVGLEGWHKADDTVKDWVATHEASLLEWKQVTERDQVWFNSSEDLLWPYEDGDFTSPLFYLGSVAALRGLKCEAEKDFAGAFEWYRASLRARDQLWSAAWMADDLSNILNWAALPEVSVAQLRTALAQVRRDRAARQPASHAIKVEYLRAMNSLRKRDGLATAIRYRSGTQSPMDTKAAVFWRFVYWVCGEPERTRRLYQHLVANQLRAIDLPAPARRAMHAPTSTLIYNDDAAVSLPSKHLSAARLAESIRMSGISHSLEGSTTGGQLLRDPNFDRILRESRAFPVLFELALVLQIHRRELGTFPTQLEDLVPDYIDAVPVDPCDLKALNVRYRLDNAEQATLWSVGSNDVDDNGFRFWDAVVVVHAPVVVVVVVVVDDGSAPEKGKD